jgi:hypothetical protein
MLEERIYSAEEWNTKIMKAMNKGLLKDRPELADGGFLMVYQSFDGVVEDTTNGKLYSCSGWVPPHRDAFVEVKEIKRP